MKSLLFLSQYIVLACLLASCDAKNANLRQNAIEQNTERQLGTSPPVHVKIAEHHHSSGGSSSGESSGSSSSSSRSGGSSSSSSSSATSGGTTSKATIHKAHTKQKGMLAVSAAGAIIAAAAFHRQRATVEVVEHPLAGSIAKRMAKFDKFVKAGNNGSGDVEMSSGYNAMPDTAVSV
uniref:Uncharacterized protein n=1 Tax=Chaetoceros debilis TaxID=122233 RepID=A0A7S3QJM3_9STRA